MKTSTVVLVVAAGVAAGITACLGTGAFLLLRHATAPPAPLPAPALIPWAEAREKLGVAVVTRRFAAFGQRELEGDEPLVSRPLRGELLEVVVAEGAYARERDRRHWGVPKDELFALARTAEERRLGLEPPSVPAGDDTGVLAFPEHLARWPGVEHLVFGNANGLVVIDVAEDGGTEVALSALTFSTLFVDDALRSPLQTLDGRLWVLRDGGVEEWVPPADVAGRYQAEVEAVEDQELEREAEWLEARHLEAVERRYTADAPPRHSFVTVSSARQLLPPADFVVFERDGQRAAVAPWSKIAARLEPVPDTIMGWSRLRAWPSDEELSALGFAKEVP